MGLPVGGLCNAVYVDDVVSAALLAAESNAAAGEQFIISGDPPVTWRQFYGGYETMLKAKAVMELNEAQMILARARQKQARSFSRRARRALARRSELRRSILNLAPNRMILAAGQLLLPTTLQRAIKHKYDALWDLSADGPPPPFMHDGFWGALYGATSRFQGRILG